MACHIHIRQLSVIFHRAFTCLPTLLPHSPFKTSKSEWSSALFPSWSLTMLRSAFLLTWAMRTEQVNGENKSFLQIQVVVSVKALHVLS